MPIYLKWIESKPVIEKEYIEILTVMLYTTSFTQTSELLGIRQIKVRYKFMSALASLKKNGYNDIYDIFNSIFDNLNSIRRIYSPIGKSKK
jgi:hypothetical protein